MLKIIKKKLYHPTKNVLAIRYLSFLRKRKGLVVIGVTGSAGKTTTKDMIASILKNVGPTVCSKDNIDPVYNIPATILRCRANTKYLVLEMGIEFPGEMDLYMKLAKPDIGVITNVYPTHTEFFGNVEGVAREKIKLASSLSADKMVILNHDNELLVKYSKKVAAKIVWFGSDQKYSHSYKGNKTTLKMGENKLIVHLPIMGEQFASNALAAATCCKELGVPVNVVKRGLENFTPPPHRMKVFNHSSGALIVDDSYNNNPQAAREALDNFNQFAAKRPKIVVIGDMLELGEISESEHRNLGRLVAKISPVYVIGVGKLSTHTVESARKSGLVNCDWVKNSHEVLPLLLPHLKKNAVVLIKGSRSINLDAVADALL